MEDSYTFEVTPEHLRRAIQQVGPGIRTLHCIMAQAIRDAVPGMADADYACSAIGWSPNRRLYLLDPVGKAIVTAFDELYRSAYSSKWKAALWSRGNAPELPARVTVTKVPVPKSAG